MKTFKRVNISKITGIILFSLLTCIFCTCCIGSEADRYFSLGKKYKDQYEYEKALSEFKKAIELEPDRAEFYYWLGITYGRMVYSVASNPSEKEMFKELEMESYEKALSIDPVAATEARYYAMLTAFFELNDYQKTIKHAKDFIKYGPFASYFKTRPIYRPGILMRLSAAHEYLKLSYQRLGNIQKAKEHKRIEQILNKRYTWFDKMRREGVWGHYWRGILFSNDKRYSKAVQSLKRVFLVLPNNPEVLATIAQVKFEEFLDICGQEFIKLEKRSQEHINKRLKQLGIKREDANINTITSYKESIKAIPAQQRKEIEQHEQAALEAAKQAIEADKDNPLAHMVLGSIYLVINEFKEAEKELLYALNTQALYPEERRYTLGVLAIVYEKLGKQELAQEYKDKEKEQDHIIDNLLYYEFKGKEEDMIP